MQDEGKRWSDERLLLLHVGRVVVLGRRGGVHWIGECGSKCIIVFVKRRLLVVEDKTQQGGINVVGFGEAVATFGLVDDAMSNVSVGPATKSILY